MFDDLPVLVEERKRVNPNELLAMCVEVEARFRSWAGTGVKPKNGFKSSLMFGRTCDVAITSIDLFMRLDASEHFADIHNFWGVDFGGETRGLFVVSPLGFAILMTDVRPLGDLESFFELGCHLINLLDLLENYATDEPEISRIASTISTTAHAYSLITRDDAYNLRKRDLQLLSRAYPNLFKSVNDPSLARRELFEFSEIVTRKCHPK